MKNIVASSVFDNLNFISIDGNSVSCPSEDGLQMARILHDIQPESQRGLQVAGFLQFKNAHLVLISVFVDQDTKLVIHGAVQVVLAGSIFDELLLDKVESFVNWFVLSLVGSKSNEVLVEIVEVFAGAGGVDIRERLKGGSPIDVRFQVYNLEIMCILESPSWISCEIHKPSVGLGIRSVALSCGASCNVLRGLGAGRSTSISKKSAFQSWIDSLPTWNALV